MITPLRFSYDPDDDVMTIEGTAYSGQFFRDFARDIPLDTPFKIVERNGFVSIEKVGRKRHKVEDA